MTTTKNTTILEYTKDELTLKEKSNLTDGEKYQKYVKSVTLNLYNRYHSEDPVIREVFREQRKINNKRAYLLKKARNAEALRFAEESIVKANII